MNFRSTAWAILLLPLITCCMEKNALSTDRLERFAGGNCPIVCIPKGNECFLPKTISPEWLIKDGGQAVPNVLL